MTAVKPLAMTFQLAPRRYVLVEKRVFGRGRYAPHKEVWVDNAPAWREIVRKFNAAKFDAEARRLREHTQTIDDAETVTVKELFTGIKG